MREFEAAIVLEDVAGSVQPWTCHYINPSKISVLDLKA